MISNCLRPLKDESGIVLITGLMLLLGLTAIGVFAINVTMVNQDISANLKASKQVFYLTEAGIQHAKIFLTQNINSWNNYATLQTIIAPTQLSNIGTYTVTIQDAGGGSRKVLSTGNTSSHAQAVIEVLFGNSPRFPYAFCSQGDITLQGGAITDSFDSRVAPYNPLTAGNNGSVKANGNVSLSGTNTRVTGNAAAGGTVTTDAGAMVTGTTTNGASPQQFPPVHPCGPPYSSSSGITGGSYDPTTGQLQGTSSDAIILAPGKYCFSSVHLAGQSTLTVNGAVQLYVTADSSFTGGGIINTPHVAANLRIFSSLSSSNQGISLTGGSQSYAAVYAPNAYVKFAGGSDFYGSVVGDSIDNTDGTNIHYDEALSALGGAGLGMLTWRQVL